MKLNQMKRSIFGSQFHSRKIHSERKKRPPKMEALKRIGQKNGLNTIGELELRI